MSTRTRKLLLIDDEDDIREVASLSLEAAGGFEVITASCGQTGVDLAAAAQPDAILLDVMMPDMDGPSTLRRLQDCAETRSIPVVFLTAKVLAADRRKLAGLGVRGIIAKPFDPLRLGLDLSSILGWNDSGTLADRESEKESC